MSDTRGGDPAKWAALFALAYNPSDPLIPLYNQALVANQPANFHGFSIGNTDAGYQGLSVASWTALGLVFLQQRSLLYMQRKPGDCASLSAPAQPQPNVGLNVGLNTVNKVVSSVPVVGTIVNIGETIGAVFANIVGGPDTDILHERALLCPMCAQFTATILQIDAQVKAGQATPQAGAAAVAQLVQAFNAKVSDGSYGASTNPCRTIGAYIFWAGAHATFRSAWYPTIASTAPSAGTGLPGAAPANPNTPAYIAAGAAVIGLIK